jgi:hypothetical protein
MRAGGGRRVALCTEDKTRLVLGFGIGISRDEAETKAEAMAALVSSPLRLQGFAPDGHHCPRNLGSYKTEDALLRGLIFKLTTWNLCVIIDGATPAMRAGIQSAPWSPRRIISTALDVVHSPVLPERKGSKPKFEVAEETAEPAALELAQATEAERDAVVMATPYGLFRVEEIIHRTDQKNHRKIRAIIDCVVRCECGVVKRVSWKHLSRGAIRSCGCLALATVAKESSSLRVRAMGAEMTIGQLAVISGRRPIQLLSRMRAGMSAEEAAFAKASK